MKQSDEVDATINELAKWGAEYLRTEVGGKHFKVIFRHAGKEQFMVCSGTGSDARGPDNARQAVRRQLGIKRPKVVGERRQRREYANAQSAAIPASFTVKRDPWGTLRRLPAGQVITAAQLDRAWLAFFGSALLDAGHFPQSPRIQSALLA